MGYGDESFPDAEHASAVAAAFSGEPVRFRQAFERAYGGVDAAPLFRVFVEVFNVIHSTVLQSPSNRLFHRDV